VAMKWPRWFCLRTPTSSVGKTLRSQLFACLVLREHQKKSYRGVEALLRDAPHWCKDIDMRGVPDHNTLCRAFHLLISHRRMNQMLDLLATGSRPPKPWAV